MSSPVDAFPSAGQLFRAPRSCWTARLSVEKFDRSHRRSCACGETPPTPHKISPLSFEPDGRMQKSVRYNEGHALFLSVVARKEGTRRGFLSKKTAENSRWHEKFFALYQNVLFYFENEQSARPSGIYLLEGCTCERAPAPKMSTTGKEALEKQVRGFISAGGLWMDAPEFTTTFRNQLPDSFCCLYTHTQSSLPSPAVPRASSLSRWRPQKTQTVKNALISPFWKQSCFHPKFLIVLKPFYLSGVTFLSRDRKM